MTDKYTPTVWKKGDIVSASKLNKIEQGIENATHGDATQSESGLMSSTDKTKLDSIDNVGTEDISRIVNSIS